MLVTGDHARVLVVNAIAAVQLELWACPGPGARRDALLALRVSLERRLGDPLTPRDVGVLVGVRREYGYAALA